MEKACEKCRFCAANRCQRFPPQNVGEQDSQFPYVDAKSWCGEFEKQTTEEDL